MAMRTFLGRLALFSVIPVAVAIITFLKADGRTDPYYLRFTTPRATSMIIGTSRPAQGILPQVLDSALAAKGREVHTFNYGFAVGYSNFGGGYLGSILRKLDPQSRNGVFIVAVDPWGLAGPQDEDIHAPLSGDGTFVAEMRCVNMDPNLEYLLTVYKKPLLEIVLPDPRLPQSPMLLHENGWLEVHLPMSATDVEKRTRGKLDEYRKTRMPGAAVSPKRIGYLQLTIDTLKQHGQVQLVRLPVDPRMLALEDSLAPHFNRYMQLLAKISGVDYLDLTSTGADWIYTDGNHLVPESGAAVTVRIADRLMQGHKAE